MSTPTEATNDVPLSSAEIAGYMNWRGPGAYTAHAERRVRTLIAEAVRREREACSKVVESDETHAAMRALGYTTNGQTSDYTDLIACAIRARKTA